MASTSRTCETCGSEFLGDVKRVTCNECLLKPYLCACGCGELIYPKTSTSKRLGYLPEHRERASSVIEGHKQQSRKMLGDNNPSRRLEVREKLSNTISGYWSKLNPKERSDRARIRAPYSLPYPKARYPDGKGNMLRSTLELTVAKLLQGFGFDYDYEPVYRLPDGRKVYPDFRTKTPIQVLVEASGAAYRGWQESLIERTGRIVAALPTMPVVIVTYAGQGASIAALTALPTVHIVELGGRPETEVALVLEGDKFNFDYSHFLPWHSGGCASFHGHSSTLSVAVFGLKDKEGWLVDFADVKNAIASAILEVDHKVFITRKYCTFINAQTVKVSWTGVGGSYDLSLPRDRVVLLTDDSTVENLSLFFATAIANKLPMTVTNVVVQMNEGVGKSAVTSYGRSPKIYTQEDLKEILAFHGVAEMLGYGFSALQEKSLSITRDNSSEIYFS